MIQSPHVIESSINRLVSHMVYQSVNRWFFSHSILITFTASASTLQSDIHRMISMKWYKRRMTITNYIYSIMGKITDVFYLVCILYMRHCFRLNFMIWVVCSQNCGDNSYEIGYGIVIQLLALKISFIYTRQILSYVHPTFSADIYAGQHCSESK